MQCNDTIIVTLIGAVGAIVAGAVISAIIKCLELKWQECVKTKKDKPRKDLLLKMLNDPKHEWRKLETLMHVIGSDEEKTKKLLLEIGARASENGKSLWALVKNKPLSEINERNL